MKPNGSLHPQRPQPPLDPKSLHVPPTDILILIFHSITILGYKLSFSIYSLIHSVLEKVGSFVAFV
jgi:hypothetical protein